METILAALISGFFTLLAVWLAHFLQKEKAISVTSSPPLDSQVPVVLARADRSSQSTKSALESVLTLGQGRDLQAMGEGWMRLPGIHSMTGVVGGMVLSIPMFCVLGILLERLGFHPLSHDHGRALFLSSWAIAGCSLMVLTIKIDKLPVCRWFP